MASAFQDMSQDDDTMKYTDLAIYLASNFFTDHNNKDVRLFVACCIADVFRVCAPDAPYTEPDMIKVCSAPCTYVKRYNFIHNLKIY